MCDEDAHNFITYVTKGNVAKLRDLLDQKKVDINLQDEVGMYASSGVVCTCLWKRIEREHRFDQGKTSY